jgi:2-oxoisovalerate dehydrogenase E1 component
MSVSRAGVLDANFAARVAAIAPGSRRVDLDAPVRDGSALTARLAIGLFEAQIESRVTDLLARELKARDQSFYTIGSSGHEGNAAVAAALEPDDWSFLHYRSGAYFCARAKLMPGPHGPLDVLLGIVASSDEPIAGGRHKVFGSHALHIPPQTSTIASQLPKAVGFAIALERRARLEGRRERAISVVSFGDASSNHSTAVGALNAAAWTAHQNLPVPVLFVCEDNGIGISVRTPESWVEAANSGRPAIKYVHADGLDVAAAYDAAVEAVTWVRERRRPAFLHLDVVRLMGHAGSDVEQTYRSPQEIAEGEARDPLIRTAELLVTNGWMTPDEVVALYDETRERLNALADEAVRRPKLTTREAIVAPLFRHDAAVVAASIPVAAPEARAAAHGGALPEDDTRPRHLAVQINRALTDVFAAEPGALLFGEDVARKGGVYHVTADLVKRFGVGRVFNTLLDEQSILGLAIGASHAGFLPFPEIQYLAYLINAIDQLRGEAGSMSFFSNGQFSNGMVVRIAGLAYQKGFGGHFHNDNGIGAVREIPGILVACPARGDDAARMLRTLAAAAKTQGRLCVFLEPIALYMTKDLHQDGDGAWLAPYPAPGDHLPVGEVGVYGDGPADVTVATFANGLWMSLRVAKRLADQGVRVRVIDLRWLHPLPIDGLVPHVADTGKLVVVDECRRSSGVADTVVAEVIERLPGTRVRRVMAPDTYIPLGAAANLVLVSEPEIEAAILDIHREAR